MLQYTNRLGDVYFPHRGLRSDGRAHYYCSKKRDPEKALDQLPEGYEFYEKPERGQVYLRKPIESLISEQERRLAQTGVAKHSGIPEWAFRVDFTKKDELTVYVSDRAEQILARVKSKDPPAAVPQSSEEDPKILPFPSELASGTSMHDMEAMLANRMAEVMREQLGMRSFEERSEDFLNKHASQSAVLKFTLDKHSPKSVRQFSVQRFHFSIDGWVSCGVAENSLESLVKHCAPTLGRESFYELGAW